MMRTNVKILHAEQTVLKMNFNVMIKRVFHHNGSMYHVQLVFFVYLDEATMCSFFLRRCDNIRDCPNAEDEENCSFCEENEFK